MIRMLSPVLEVGVPWEKLVEELDILLRALVDFRRVNDVLSLLRLQQESPLPRKVLPRPLLDLSKVPARVCRCQTGKYSLLRGDVDMEWDGRDVCMTHDGLTERIDAVV
jgi:hypothetical protein